MDGTLIGSLAMVAGAVIILGIFFYLSYKDGQRQEQFMRDVGAPWVKDSDRFDNQDN